MNFMIINKLINAKIQNEYHRFRKMNFIYFRFELKTDEFDFVLTLQSARHAAMHILGSLSVAPKVPARSCNFLMGKLMCPQGATFRNMQNFTGKEENLKLPNLADYHYFR